MPTRIVLKESAAPSRLRGRDFDHDSPRSQHSRDDHDDTKDYDGNNKYHPFWEEKNNEGKNNNGSNSKGAASPRIGSSSLATTKTAHCRRRASASKRRKFRSSILETLSIREDADDNVEAGDDSYDDDYDYPDVDRLSSDDIRGSPRLLGYLFAMIASAVMLVSVVQFYLLPTVTDPVTIEGEKYFVIPTGAVQWWKLWGAMVIAGVGCLINLLTIMVHFDTVCFPRTWISVFRDGSLRERNWIFFLVLFWAVGLHVCTSSLSVGEKQANVYFTTWIGFASTLANLSVWRESAGLPTPFELTSSQHRETTYNWIWTAFFSIIFAGAITDVYCNRDEIEATHTVLPTAQSNNMIFSSYKWVTVLVIVWVEVGICLVSITLNEWCYNLTPLPCRCRRKSEYYKCVVGWRQLEGLVILMELGVKFYVILEYTGVGGVINGLSNAYFGVWGSFFNSVFCFGTWLKESKNITFVVREDDNEYE